MSFLNTLMKGVKAVAPAVANYVVPGSGSLIDGLLRKVTGDNESPLEDLAQKVQADPMLYVEFEKAVMEQELKLADIDAKKIESVNRTMQAESKSEHWAQWGWRPYNGFLYGTTVFCVYFIIPIANAMFSPEPRIPIPEVPVMIWGGWGAILGVTTWSRGKEKRAKAGEQKTGLIEGVINSIRK